MNELVPKRVAGLPSWDASGDVCFNGKPKELCWYSVLLGAREDAAGSWMSFEDRGPQSRAVSTMTWSAKGGTTLQECCVSQISGLQGGVYQGASPKAASNFGLAVFRQQEAQPIPSKPRNSSHTHLKPNRSEVASEKNTKQNKKSFWFFFTKGKNEFWDNCTSNCILFCVKQWTESHIGFKRHESKSIRPVWYIEIKSISGEIQLNKYLPYYFNLGTYLLTNHYNKSLMV